MTVSELIKELQRYPKDAHVYLVKDWEAMDEDNHFTDLADVLDVADDVVTIDTGMCFEDEHRIIISD